MCQYVYVFLLNTVDLVQLVVCYAFWVCFNTSRHSSTSVRLVIPVCLY